MNTISAWRRYAAATLFTTLAALVFTSAASAAPLPDTSTYSYRYNANSSGKFGNVFRNVTTPKLCASGAPGYINIYISLQGGDYVYHESGTKRDSYSDISLSVSKYNSCNGKFSSGFGWLDGSKIGINGSLSSGTMQQSVPMCDYSSSYWTKWSPYAGTASVATVDVTFFADGIQKTKTGTYKWRFRAPDFRILDIFKGSFRSVATKGSVTYQGVTYDMSTNATVQSEPLGTPVAEGASVAGAPFNAIPENWAVLGQFDSKTRQQIKSFMLPPAPTGEAPSAVLVNDCSIFGPPVLAAPSA